MDDFDYIGFDDESKEDEEDYGFYEAKEKYENELERKLAVRNTR